MSTHTRTMDRFRRADGTFPPIAGADPTAPVTSPDAEIRSRYDAAVRSLQEANDAIQHLPADATDEQRTSAQTTFDTASSECRSLREQVQRQHDVEEARRLAPIAPTEDTDGIEDRNGGAADVSIGYEPGTYGRHVPKRSYFLDLARVQALGDHEARSRLKAHADEIGTEFERREKQHARGMTQGLEKLLEDLPSSVASRVADIMGAEKRALSTTDGAGGDFVPPLYLVDEYIPLARAGRPFVNACRNIPLPAGTDSINLPKISTGTATAIQATQNTAAQNTDMTTSTVNAPVRTIAGQQTVALQLLEQSPINYDEVVFQDLLDDYFYRCEEQAFIGSGAAGQLKGILNATGILTITYTDLSPTVPELYPKIADGLRQGRENRKKPLTHGWVAPRRGYWFLAALDTSNRPLVTPSVAGPNNALGVPTIDGGGSGEDVAIDALVRHRMTDAIPVNLGAGTNEDRIVLTRNADHVFFEGALRARSLAETKGDQLSVMLQVYNYCAFTAERFPTGVSVIAGTGLVTPTF